MAQPSKRRRGKGNKAPPWLPEEDAILRKSYRKRTNIELLEVLPSKTFDAIRSRLRALGLRRKKVRKWTADEEKTLLLEWKELNPRSLRAKLKGRSWASIHAKAEEMGLPDGVPQGYLSLSQLEAKTGFSRKKLRLILEAASVQLKNSYPSRRRQSTQRAWSYIVEEGAALAAVEWFVGLETLGAWIKRTGVGNKMAAEEAERLGLPRTRVGAFDYYASPELERLHKAIRARKEAGPKRRSTPCSP